MRDRSVRLALVRLVGPGHAEAVLDSDAGGLGPSLTCTTGSRARASISADVIFTGATHAEGMPPLGYRIVPGHGLRIEVEQPNGARALIVGTLDSIPIAAGGEALHLVICNATVTALPAKQ